ncbi:MAG: hypothetical protein ACRDV9_04935 [Acidimicrobiia bacterium]
MAHEGAFGAREVVVGNGREVRERVFREREEQFGIYSGGMSMTVNLPEDLAQRLTAEAERRGQDVDQVAADLLAAQLPAEGVTRPRKRLSFSGIGASGGGEAIGRNHEAILRQAFSEKTARDA